MKLFFITIFVFILSTPSFTSVKEVKKMVYKSEKYNLGLKKKDTTVNGLKLKPLMNKEAFENAVKKNYGWLDYGFNIVHAQDGEPLQEVFLRAQILQKDIYELHRALHESA